MAKPDINPGAPIPVPAERELRVGNLPQVSAGMEGLHAAVRAFRGGDRSAAANLSRPTIEGLFHLDTLRGFHRARNASPDEFEKGAEIVGLEGSWIGGIRPSDPKQEDNRITVELARTDSFSTVEMTYMTREESGEEVLTVITSRDGKKPKKPEGEIFITPTVIQTATFVFDKEGGYRLRGRESRDQRYGMHVSADGAVEMFDTDEVAAITPIAPVGVKYSMVTTLEPYTGAEKAPVALLFETGEAVTEHTPAGPERPETWTTVQPVTIKRR